MLTLLQHADPPEGSEIAHAASSASQPPWNNTVTTSAQAERRVPAPVSEPSLPLPTDPQRPTIQCTPCQESNEPVCRAHPSECNQTVRWDQAKVSVCMNCFDRVSQTKVGIDDNQHPIYNRSFNPSECQMENVQLKRLEAIQQRAAHRRFTERAKKRLIAEGQRSDTLSRNSLQNTDTL